MGEAKYVPSNPAKQMRFTSSSEKDPSSATFDEVTKSTRGINTMSRVVKRKIQKIKPVVEYNKSGRPHGKATIEMQSYIGVLAHSILPLVDKKWTQLPKDLKEQIWKAVQMAYVVGEGGKKMVLSSAAKKWKDFKSTLTREFILPFANEKEKLKEPSQLYNFIKKSQWDAFVASRLFPDFEVAKKAKLIDDLKKQVSEGTLTVSGSNDVLTLALGTPEHGGRVRALCQYVETKLKPANETIRIHMPEEVFGTEHDTWLLCGDILQFASMVEIGSTVIALYMR
ncbi:hypothetical protein L3X38_033252 [Prunus dulcis]|uniref:Uncharacterized protein n=1 Tax=Prunus dulcis TaxID=3755 RepID=A0AAD4VFJ2_PRUDU|nr:hypothetical protein L3X38_033252 [Prunus dulcis]